ncbi:dipeptide/oligopeptide/nickel ABC transporter permease/ATP-binding protein [Pseudonocardia pini]|uniref:dipeptide/oligopeptide/nickel ABC transporter permease/ATP-binding protein n=1 Tax=Pseudonocardia pini TaxID=2758030 RepID=UPI0015F11F77|nr:dipeptide/oligopeptide/nickel ABC transporter permease/ATP-binding protein [Pseudonocardia pini]
MSPRATAGPTAAALRRFRRDRVPMIALAFLVVVTVAGVLAGVLAPFEPFAQLAGPPFDGPSAAHLLGTDDLGRDVLSRLLYGARVSMEVSILTVAGALVVALPLGLVAGYSGRRVDQVLMRVMDALMSFPALVLAIVLVAVLGPSLTNTMLAIGVFLVPTFCRLVRGQALAVREEAYVDASRSIGTPDRTIILRHVLPNLLSPMIVQATTTLGMVLIAEASLSFLGLGAQPPQVSWGAMLRQAYEFILVDPSLMLAPGIAIALTVFAFNVVGDGLLDALGRLGPGTRRRKGAQLGLTAVDRRQDDAGGGDPPDPGSLLSVRGLRIEFDTPTGPVTVVQDVSFDIARGETLGLVGESGSGKTVTSLSVLRLLLAPAARVTAGRAFFDGRDLLGLSRESLQQVRGREIGVVFQDPMASLTPSLTVLDQVAEVVRWHQDVSRATARERALEMLGLVGIAPERASSYPHEFSGGMQQRAAIAVALVCGPKLLIADEPTTALDVTVQAQILDLLRDLSARLGLAVLFVTHDLGVIAEIADRVVVMYAGQVVETASVRRLFHSPRHPYADALLRSMPDRTPWGEDLATLPGRVPPPSAFGPGCRLAPRCAHAEDVCSAQPIDLRGHAGDDDHLVRCRRAEDLVLDRSAR